MKNKFFLIVLLMIVCFGLLSRVYAETDGESIVSATEGIPLEETYISESLEDNQTQNTIECESYVDESELQTEVDIVETDSLETGTINLLNESSLQENTGSQCGDNAYYKIDTDGTCTISGNGPLYASYFESWANIKKLVIEEGITNIGSETFQNCSNLELVQLPSSLIDIGDKAFSQCVSLRDVYMAEGLESVYSSAFSQCTALTSIKFPDSVT